MNDERALELLADVRRSTVFRQDDWMNGRMRVVALDYIANRIAQKPAAPEPEIIAAGWRSIETAPKDGTEFLSHGGPDNTSGDVQPTRWLSPGPYATENGKNQQGERRYQFPDGFYWAGYDGFVGPVHPTSWIAKPAPPKESQ